jgi:ribosomal protein L24
MNQIDHEVTLTFENIQKGVMVQVTSGSLQGIKGEVLNILGQSRLMIRINSMNCCIYANISRDEVRILEETPSEMIAYAAI